MKDTLKKLMNELKEAREKANKLDAAWDEEPENEEIEAAWDEAYKAEFEAFERMAQALAELLSNYNGGVYDLPVARAVLRKKFDEVANLIERLA